MSFGTFFRGRSSVRIEGNATIPVHEVLSILVGYNEQVKTKLTLALAKAILKQARRNITAGGRESKYPQTGRLASTLRYEATAEGFNVLAGGNGVRYAGLMDKPVGTYEVLTPTRAKYLRFIHYRVGERAWRKRESVAKPGTAFLSRAVDTVVSTQNVKIIAADVIAGVNKEWARKGTIIKLDSSGAGKYRLGSLSVAKAQNLGLVKQHKDGYRLTSAGKRYVGMSPTQKRAFRKIARGKL